MSTSCLSHSPAVTLLNFKLHGRRRSSLPKQSLPTITFTPSNKPKFLLNSKHAAAFQEISNPCLQFPKLSIPRASADDVLETIEKHGSLGDEEKPVKFLLWTLLWASLSVCFFALSGDAKAAAAADSIKASGFGVKVANSLRILGWADEVVVFALATLPVLELRGAIPVGYWLQLQPLPLTLLSVLGNMVPVPFIVLYLKRLAAFLVAKNQTASRFLQMFLDWTKKKAGPIEEFQWLGLMLFVAVPFPGTGAWTGAIIASLLEMPFWSAVSANFVGVVLAGLLVNLLVNLGLNYAIITGAILFVVSTFMWSVLRSIKRSVNLSP